MVRTILVALVFVAAGVLLWTMATWPVSQGPDGVAVEFAEAAPEVATDDSLEEQEVRTDFETDPEAPAPEPLDEGEEGPLEEGVHAAPALPLSEDMFDRDHGPVEEYRSAFEREPRGSGNAALESEIRAAFTRPGAPAGLLGAALCRKTICKVEVRWSPDRTGEYVAAMTLLSPNFDREIAVVSHPKANKDDLRVIDVYMKRGAADPAE
jgi:hypothetical protein